MGAPEIVLEMKGGGAELDLEAAAKRLLDVEARAHHDRSRPPAHGTELGLPHRHDGSVLCPAGYVASAELHRSEAGPVPARRAAAAPAEDHGGGRSQREQ